jgi:putative ATP-dependent endonuclease of the OLD family
LRVLHCSIQNFRGFDTIEVIPRGHVLLVGEPRSGRSDLLAALSKVFEVDLTRLDERDFFRGDTGANIDIEVTLGDLGQELEQRFLDELEFWDPAANALVVGGDDLGSLPAGLTPAVRLSFRGRWDDIDERGDQTIYWPKRSDPSMDLFRRVRRDDRRVFPFRHLPGGRPLNLAPRGLLRLALTATEAEALNEALQGMRDGIDHLSGELALALPVIAALDATIEVLRPYLGSEAPVEEIVRFLPDEGSLSGLLRALTPALDLGDDVGFLPLVRHGSTTLSQVAMAEAIATASHEQAVVSIDDFGDALDTSSSQRLATLLRRDCGQIWLSTRRPETAHSFEPSELIRLTRSAPANPSPSRIVHYGVTPTSRAERLAFREMHRQILPAMTARSLVVVEGPHDSAGYSALAERREVVDGTLPPESYGVRIIDGGAQGGIDHAARLAEMGRSLGFRIVALVDYDRDETAAASRLAALQSAADSVVRLPKGMAIEAALLEGVPDSDVADAMTELATRYQLPHQADWATLTGPDLKTEVIRALKSNNGLHSQFVGALPGVLPSMGCQAINAAIECGRGINPSVFVQL